MLLFFDSSFGVKFNYPSIFCVLFAFLLFIHNYFPTFKPFILASFFFSFVCSCFLFLNIISHELLSSCLINEWTTFFIQLFFESSSLYKLSMFVAHVVTRCSLSPSDSDNLMNNPVWFYL